MYVFCVFFAFTALEFPQEQRKPRYIGKGTTFNQIAKTSIDFFSTQIFPAFILPYGIGMGSTERIMLIGDHNQSMMMLG